MARKKLAGAKERRDGSKLQSKTIPIAIPSQVPVVRDFAINLHARLTTLASNQANLPPSQQHAQLIYTPTTEPPNARNNTTNILPPASSRRMQNKMCDLFSEVDAFIDEEGSIQRAREELQATLGEEVQDDADVALEAAILKEAQVKLDEVKLAERNTKVAIAESLNGDETILSPFGSPIGLPQRLLHQPSGHTVDELDWLPATPHHSPMPHGQPHPHEPNGPPEIPVLLYVGHLVGSVALLPWLTLLFIVKFIPHPWAGKSKHSLYRIGMVLLFLSPILVPALLLTACWWPVMLLDYLHYRTSTGESAIPFTGFASTADADIGKAESHGECTQCVIVCQS
jgi:hypothetical protein